MLTSVLMLAPLAETGQQLPGKGGALTASNGWEVEAPEVSSITLELVDGRLEMRAEPSADARKQYRVNRKVSLGGDFDVAVEFELVEPLPAPTNKWVSLELVLRGSTANINMSRSHHFGKGDGLATSIRFKGSDASGNFWRHTPQPATAGVLRISRTGDQLAYRFLPLSDDDVSAPTEDADGTATTSPERWSLDDPFELIGSSAFAGRVWGITLALNVHSPTEVPVEARFSSFRLRGDFQPRPTASRPRTELLVMAAVGALGAFLLGIVCTRFLRRGY